MQITMPVDGRSGDNMAQTRLTPSPRQGTIKNDLFVGSGPVNNGKKSIMPVGQPTHQTMMATSQPTGSDAIVPPKPTEPPQNFIPEPRPTPTPAPSPTLPSTPAKGTPTLGQPAPMAELGQAQQAYITPIEAPTSNIAAASQVTAPTISKPQQTQSSLPSLSMQSISAPNRNYSGGGSVGNVAAPGTPELQQFNGNGNVSTGLNTGDRYNINAGRDTFASSAGDFSRFEDSAMQSARRQLDPYWQERQSEFEQQMVNKGLTPGTEAFDNAMANFERSRNDAYGSAAFNAMQFGLGAQNQAFNQDATTYSLNNQDKYNSLSVALQNAGMNEGARQFDANADFRDQQTSFQNNLTQSQYNNSLQQQDYSNQFNNAQFQAGQNQFGAQLGEQARQFNAGMNMQGDQLAAQIAQMNNQNALTQAQFNEGQRQFDSGMGFNFANLGANVDQMNAQNMFNAAGMNEQMRQFNSNNQMQYDQLAAQIAQMNNQFNLSNAQLGEQQRQFNGNFAFGNSQLGEQQRQYDANYGLQRQNQMWNQGFAQNQNDFSQLMQLDNMNRAYQDMAFRDAQFNAQQEAQQYQMLVSALMGMQPQMGGSNIDVMGAYNTANNAAMNQYNMAYQNAMNNRSGFNGLLGVGANLLGGWLLG